MNPTKKYKITKSLIYSGQATANGSSSHGQGGRDNVLTKLNNLILFCLFIRSRKGRLSCNLPDVKETGFHGSWFLISHSHKTLNLSIDLERFLKKLKEVGREKC